MIISVMAAENVHIALSDTHTSNASIYEIGIGEQGNKISSISKSGVSQKTTNTLNYLNANDVTDFYILFDNGRIRVGRGRFPYPERFDPFLDWQDTDNKPINVVSVGLASPTSDAEWRLHVDMGKV